LPDSAANQQKGLYSTRLSLALCQAREVNYFYPWYWFAI